MNNDLISREDLRENIERIKHNVEEWVNHTECDTTKALVKISLFEEFIGLINSAPTISDIPKGEWIVTEETDEFYGKVYKCTKCGNKVMACDCRTSVLGADQI